MAVRKNLLSQNLRTNRSFPESKWEWTWTFLKIVEGFGRKNTIAVLKFKMDFFKSGGGSR